MPEVEMRHCHAFCGGCAQALRPAAQGKADSRYREVVAANVSWR